MFELIRNNIRKFIDISSTRKQYPYDLSTLDPSNRKRGISGFMRLRNEEDFMEKSILSHLPYLDELIIVYNRCTDNTPKLADHFARSYPDKVKVFHYEPHVYPQGSEKHSLLPPTSPNSLVRYSNFALSKTTYKIAIKIDGDNIAIPKVIEKVTFDIRKNGRNKYLIFNGINLWDSYNEIYIKNTEPFTMVGDSGFFPVNKTTFFIHHPWYEKFNHYLIGSYIGILFFHLKGMKKDRGLTNYDLNDNPSSRYHKLWKEFSDNPKLLTWGDFVKKYHLENKIPHPSLLGIKPPIRS